MPSREVISARMVAYQEVANLVATVLPGGKLRLPFESNQFTPDKQKKLIRREVEKIFLSMRKRENKEWDKLAAIVREEHLAAEKD